MCIGCRVRHRRKDTAREMCTGCRAAALNLGAIVSSPTCRKAGVPKQSAFGR